MTQQKWEWNVAFLFSLASHEIILLTSYEIESVWRDVHGHPNPVWFSKTVWVCEFEFEWICGIWYFCETWFLLCVIVCVVFLVLNIYKLLFYFSRAVINSRWYLLFFRLILDFFTIWWIVMELIKQKVGYFCWSFGFVFGNNTTWE